MLKTELLRCRTRALLALTLSVAGAASFAAGNGTDLFGRPDSGFDAQNSAYAADPFDPLPQFWTRRTIALSSGAGGEFGQAGGNSFRFDATENYYTNDPFDPLPQFWARRSGGSSIRDQDRNAAGDGSKRDIFGRPYTNLSATDVYYTADPFDPLPQFWMRGSATTATADLEPRDERLWLFKGFAMKEPIIP